MTYDRQYLGDDVRAGIVVFLVALPLCLGIALASSAPLFSGLIAGIAGGLVVTVVSKSRHGVSGPAAGLAVMVAAGIEALGIEAYLLAVIVCGVAQLVAAFLRAGVIAHYFPSSVIKGMLAGIGIILILKQIPHAFGYDRSWEGELEFVQRDGHNTFSEIGYALQALSPGAIIVTALSLAILLLWQGPRFKQTRIAKTLPAPLLVVLLGVGLNRLFGAVRPDLSISQEHLVSVPLSSSVEEFFSNFIRPDFSQITNPEVYAIGLTLALIASIETLLSVEATDNLDPEKRVTPTNQELKAQGLGNIVSGLLGGIPVTQVIVRSTANIESGGKTRLSSFIHGVLLLICVASIPELLNEIPLASLAAILLVIGYKLARVPLFKAMWKEGFWQFVPFVVTIVGLVFTDLLTGIMLGMAVAFFEILIYNYQLNFYREETSAGSFTIRLTEHMTFLNKASLKRLLREVPPDCAVTIDMSSTRILDHDVREVIEDFTTHAAADGIDVTVLGSTRPTIALTDGV
ncbi:MAG: SulP family inorganic anion transporter [Deltaproteobacteria bacterium]|nr:SulP family inorganic anion transporter [Deltaproteobacteria bacterium]